uniref:Uncharacterized protein n=2 Tax=Hemiselmis andersenii TaxID=464988 RepID=A0A7S1GXZ2_HEMAN|mmetsp:Transcript_22540/g.54911  ORF Transcript_22540/g.54911 Transcript_22540/m.54911 type:complete len:559 (+) Transcript_22540:58-1734(+)
MAVLEGDELEKALLAFVKSQRSVADPAAVAAATDASFAKGIGGTKADHIAEKLMSEALRDTNLSQGAKASGESAFEAWIKGTSMAATKVANGKAAPPPGEYAKGKWIRTLNQQETCYLYVHTATYQVQGTRPEDYVGDDDGGPAVDPFASFPTTNLDGLKDTISDLWKGFKSALILCDGDSGYAEARAQLEKDGAIFLDVKPFVQGVIKTKIKFADHVETARQTAVKAMKAGKTMVIDLSDVGTPDWKEKICGVEAYKKVFPSWMLSPENNRECDKHGQIFKKEDKKDGPNGEDWDEHLNKTIVDYRIVYLSSCGPGNYEKDITLPFLPLGKWSAVRIKNVSNVREISIKALVTAIDEAVHAHGKVPLVLDETENTDTFLAFQHTSVIEMKGLILKKATIGIDGVREEMRKKLVEALKNGNTLLLRLTNSAPDLLGDYATDDCFPAKAVFGCRTEEIEEEEDPTEQQATGFGGMLGGATPGYNQQGAAPGAKTKGVFEVAGKEWLEKIYRDADKEAGACVARAGFKVVVTSSYPYEEAKAKLSQGMPFGAFQVIKVTE